MDNKTEDLTHSDGILLSIDPESEPDQEEIDSYLLGDSMRAILNEVGKEAVLTPEEELLLAEKMVSGDEKAKDKLFHCNLRLVISIARRYQGQGLDLPDLIQEGNIGLWKAIERFDPARGFKLSTYATWWIRQGISRAIMDTGKTIKIPVHMAELLARLRKYQNAFSSTNGRDPSIEEIARDNDWTIQETKKYLFRLELQPISLDLPIGEKDGDSFVEMIPCPSLGPDSIITAENTKEKLDNLMTGCLSPKEKTVIELRLGLQDGVARTLDEVGNLYGVTRERIRQIEAKGIRKLRKPKQYRTLCELLSV